MKNKTVFLRHQPKAVVPTVVGVMHEDKQTDVTEQTS